MYVHIANLLVLYDHSAQGRILGGLWGPQPPGSLKGHQKEKKKERERREKGKRRKRKGKRKEGTKKEKKKER